MRERGLRSRMLLQVHDELVFETDEDELPALAALVEEIMEGALPLDVPLEVDLKVGTELGADGPIPAGRGPGARAEVGGAGGRRGRGRGRRALVRGRRNGRSAASEPSPIYHTYRRAPVLHAAIGTLHRMPELPEVETVARDLQRWVAGATIRDARRSTGSARSAIRSRAERFVAEIAGATIRRVSRRAKTVLLHLDDGRVMTVALRMTGALIVADAGAPPDPYARVVFELADGRELRYRDVRKFGRIGLWPGGGLRSVGAGRGARSRRVAEGGRRYRIGEVFSGHGPEPLQRGFTAARLAERLSRRSAKLKTLLLDQSFIAGVGNIYADEALWRARLHPLRAADTLDAARRAAAASGRAPGAARGDRQPRGELQRLRRRRWRARATTPSGWPSISAPSSRASAAARPIRAHRRRPAQHPLLPALPARAGRIGRAMKVIGLTGNIGCGKSTVAGMLRDLGVATVDADAVAREIRHNDADARAEIQRRFGTYEADELARVVFTDAGALARPRGDPPPAGSRRDPRPARGAGAGRGRRRRRRGDQAARVAARRCAATQVWVVRCDEADAIRRLAASRGMDEATARQRLASQSSQEEKVAAADVVIDGSAPIDETRRQVERALATLRGGLVAGLC